MKLLSQIGWFSANVLMLYAAVCLPVALGADPVQLISAPDASQSSPAPGSGDSFLPVISSTPDGRYVVFST